MSDFESVDFFADESLTEDPYPYFEQLRAVCPVLPLPHLGVVAVTGYGEEANREKSLEAGFDLHIVKPVELESIRSLLDGTRNSPANGSPVKDAAKN